MRSQRPTFPSISSSQFCGFHQHPHAATDPDGSSRDKDWTDHEERHPESESVFLNSQSRSSFRPSVSSALLHLSNLPASKSSTSVFTSKREGDDNLRRPVGSTLSHRLPVSDSSVFLQSSTLLDRGFADGAAVVTAVASPRNGLGSSPPSPDSGTLCLLVRAEPGAYGGVVEVNSPSLAASNPKFGFGDQACGRNSHEFNQSKLRADEICFHTLVLASHLQNGVSKSMLAPYLYPKTDSVSEASIRSEFSEDNKNTASPFHLHRSAISALREPWNQNMDSMPPIVDNAIVIAVHSDWTYPTMKRSQEQAVNINSSDQAQSLDKGSDERSLQSGITIPTKAKGHPKTLLETREHSSDSCHTSTATINMGFHSTFDRNLIDGVSRFRSGPGYTGNTLKLLTSVTGPISLLEDRRSAGEDSLQVDDRAELDQSLDGQYSSIISQEAKIQPRLLRLFGWNDPLIASCHHAIFYIGMVTKTTPNTVSMTHQHGNFVVVTYTKSSRITEAACGPLFANCLPPRAHITEAGAELANAATEKHSGKSSTNRLKPKRVNKGIANTKQASPTDRYPLVPFQPIKQNPTHRTVDRLPLSSTASRQPAAMSVQSNPAQPALRKAG